MYYQPLLITTSNPSVKISKYQELIPQGIDLPLTDSNPDIKILMPDGKKKSIGVEETQSWTRWLQMKPFQYKVKLGIIADANSLTTPAQNALLKSLEEPTPGTMIWIFATGPKALLSTLRSRCREVSAGGNGPSLDSQGLEKLANILVFKPYPEKVKVVEQVQQELSVAEQQQLIKLIMKEIISLPEQSTHQLAMLEIAKTAYKALAAGVTSKLTWETLGISIELANS